MRPTLVVYHMKGCGACEALMPALDALRDVDVLKVVRGHPFEEEASSVWGLPKLEWYPEILLACPRGVFKHRGKRTTEALQQWIDSASSRPYEKVGKDASRALRRDEESRATKLGR